MYNYYDSFLVRYIEADEVQRQKSKEHWLKCHMENVKSGRKDLIMFTEQILSRISIAESGNAAEYLRNVI